MPLYSYTAIDRDGKVFFYRNHAKSSSVLRFSLLKEGLFLVRCQRCIFTKFWFSDSSENLELVYKFSSTLGMLMSADISLYQAMDVLEEEDNGRLVNLVSCLRRDIDRGNSFSAAAAVHPELFGPVYLAALKMAEATGDQTAALSEIAASARWQLDFRNSVRKILIYPFLVALLMIVVFLYLMIFVVPELRAFVETVGQELPFYTLMLFGLSDFLFSSGIFLLMILVIVISSVLIAYSKSYTFRVWVWNRTLRIKFLGPLLVRSEISSFSHSMSVLSYANKDVVSSLELSRSSVKSIVFKDALSVVAKRLDSGVGLSTAIATIPVFPPEVAKLVLIGEQSGRLGDAFRNLRLIYERKIQETVDRIEILTGPFFILVLGGLVMWLVMSIVSPLYNVLNLPGMLQ